MNTLHKLIAAGSAVAMIAGATPAFARDSQHDLSLSLNAQSETHYDSDCLEVAVETRHEAKVDAYAAYRADIAADVAVRTAALVTANAITDDEDRVVAIKAAWMAYFNATADARAELKSDIKAANDAFMTAKADCIVDSDEDDDDDNEDDDDNDGLVKGWNGKDNGWHRGWLKNGKFRR